MVKIRSLVIGLLGALQLSPLVAAQGLFEPSTENASLSRRAVVNGNVCATADIGVLGINIASGVCICLEGGVITPESLTRLNTIVTANSGILAVPLRLLGGVTGVVTRIVSTLVPATDTSCVYPANSTPNQCGGCGYECKSGYVNCGNFCVATGTACVSGIPQSPARRHLTRDSLNRCSFGYEACRLPGAPRNALAFECIDTTSDLESCGGCVVPFAGRPTGVDCSALPNVASASCEGGRCVIHSCEKGYEFLGDECVEGSETLATGFWEGLHAMARLEGI